MEYSAYHHLLQEERRRSSDSDSDMIGDDSFSDSDNGDNSSNIDDDDKNNKSGVAEMERTVTASAAGCVAAAKLICQLKGDDESIKDLNLIGCNSMLTRLIRERPNDFVGAFRGNSSVETVKLNPLDESESVYVAWALTGLKSLKELS